MAVKAPKHPFIGNFGELWSTGIQGFGHHGDQRDRSEDIRHESLREGLSLVPAVSTYALNIAPYMGGRFHLLRLAPTPNVRRSMQ
jgi:hypothetical protein